HRRYQSFHRRLDALRPFAHLYLQPADSREFTTALRPPVSTCYSPAEQLLLGCLLRLRSLYRCAIGIRYAVPVSLPFRPLNHLTEDQPEITDLIASHDPVTLERLPVRKESVLDTFASFQNRRAIAAVRAIPDRN